MGGKQKGERRARDRNELCMCIGEGGGGGEFYIKKWDAYTVEEEQTTWRGARSDVERAC